MNSAEASESEDSTIESGSFKKTEVIFDEGKEEKSESLPTLNDLENELNSRATLGLGYNKRIFG